MIQSNLNKLIRSLPQPGSYFKGISPSFNALPKEIVVFNRSKPIRDRITVHQRFVLVINIDGQGAIVVNDNLYELSPMHGLLIFPHQSHHYVQFEDKDILWLFIGFEFSDENALLPIKDSPIHITPALKQELLDILGAYDKATKKNKKKDTLLTIKLCNFLENIVQHKMKSCHLPMLSSSKIPNQKMELLSQVNRYVFDHIQESIRIPDLSKHVCMSESHLRKVVREAIGISLGELIQRTQLYKACSLLKDTDMNMSMIAENCGYSSIYSFSRAFKKKMQKTPTEFRQHIRLLTD